MFLTIITVSALFRFSSLNDSSPDSLQMQPGFDGQAIWVTPNGQPVLMYNGGQVRVAVL
jgi:hypothetical protein